MSDILIQRVKVADPRSQWNEQVVDIHVQSGVISSIVSSDEGIKPSDNQVSFEEETLISPGWVDMQAHLQVPGSEHKETLAEFTEAAARGGFTHVCAYVHAQPALDHASLLKALVSQASPFPTSLHLLGNLTQGDQGKELAELFDMHAQGAIGFSNGLQSVEDASLLMRALRYLSSFDGLLVLHPFTHSMATDALVAEGIDSLQLGMAPEPPIAQTTALARDLEIFTYTTSRIHLQPLVTPRAWELLEAYKSHALNVSTGISLPYLTLDTQHLEAFDAQYKLFPSLPTPDSRSALVDLLISGKMDVLSSGHHAQGLEEKEVEFSLAEPGMLGFQTFFPIVHTSLIEAEGLSWDQFVELVAHRPREILRLPICPIEAGATADFTCFSPQKEWTLTPTDIPSTAKNSPYLHQSLKGGISGIYHDHKWYRFD